MKPLSVAQFTDSYTPITDGVANVVANYYNCFNEKYGDCYVLAPDFPETKNINEEKVYRFFSLPVKKRDPYRLGVNILDFEFNKIVKNVPLDIIHAHSPFSAGRSALRLGKKKGVPVVATFHSKYYEDFKQAMKLESFAKIGLKYVIDFYNKADYVWTVSEGAVETLYEYGYKGEVEVVNNGTDFNKEKKLLSAKQKQELGFKDNQLIFLFVGQHIWQKNVELIINALSILNKEDVDFKMIFVGDGEAKADMESMVLEKGLSKKVLFTGNINNREYLKALYSSSDLFLFPSLYDTAGIVIKEAAAVGTPSLVLKDSNPAEGIIDGYNGFISNNSIEDYSNKLITISSQKDILSSAGQNASNTLHKCWKDVVEEVYYKYLDIIERHKRKVI